MARVICILAVTLFVSVGCGDESPSLSPTAVGPFKGFLDSVPPSSPSCVAGCVPGVFCPARLRCPPANMPRAAVLDGEASSPAGEASSSAVAP
jgi:hypothetical protein